MTHTRSTRSSWFSLQILVVLSMVLGSTNFNHGAVYAQESSPEATSEVTQETVTVTPEITEFPTSDSLAPATETPTPEVTIIPPDLIPPTVNFLSPDASPITDSPVMISLLVEDADSGIKDVELWISSPDNAFAPAQLALLTQSPFEYSWDWIGLDVDNVRITAIAWDNALNKTEISQEVSLVKETALPQMLGGPFTNDNLAEATLIETLPFSESINSQSASIAPEDPTITGCQIGQGQASVWYTFTAAQDGVLMMDTRASDYDTVLALWEGSQSTLTLLDCNNDISSDPTPDINSEMEVSVRSGHTYWIEVVQSETSVTDPAGGNLTLHVDLTPCFTLTTSLNIPAGGTLTVTPPNCLSDMYVSGSEISLTVIPNTGFTFFRWDSGNTTNPLILTIDQNLVLKGLLDIKPGVPSLVSPVNGSYATSLTPLLDWADSSPVADHYEIQLSWNKTFTSVFKSITDIKTSQLLSSPVPALINFYWRVRGVSASGIASSWSLYRMLNTPLAPPVLNSPSMGYHVLTARPVFSWVAAKSATNYSLQVSPFDNFTGTVSSFTVTGTSYTPTADLARSVPLFWRMRSNGTHPSEWSPAITFQSANPPSIPGLALPINTSLQINPPTILDWADVSAPTPAVEYQLEYATNSSFTTDYSRVDNLTESTYTITDWLRNKTYYWRVRALNDAGEYSLWSTVFTFRTQLSAPELLQPADLGHAFLLTPQFQWNPSLGAVDYTLQIGQNAAFTGTLLTYKTSSTSYTPTAGLVRGIQLFWRVKANGANPSPYSVTYQFLSANPPAAPVLTAPVSSVLLPGYLPMLDWKDVPNAVRYEVQLSRNTGMTTDLQSLFVDGQSIFTFIDPLSQNRTYYWRVRAVNSLDEMSPWSLVWKFRTPLLTPVLTSVDGSEPVNNTRPQFSWSPIPGVTSYTMQIAKSNLFPTLVWSYTGTASTITPTIDLPLNINLYYRVKANGSNPSGWSAISNFLSANPPSTPVMVKPIKGSMVTSLTPTLDWNSSLNMPAMYVVQVANSSSFTGDLTEYSVPATNSDLIIPSPLENNKTFYWRVRAENPTPHFSQWSTTWTFRTPMAAPGLSSPEDAIHVTSLRPTFFWVAVPGATNYTLQLATNTAFNKGLVSYTTASITFIPNVDLVRSKTVYWRVKANGPNPSGWSATRSVMTGNPPGAPTTYNPVSGYVYTFFPWSSGMYFEWKKPTGTIAYYLFEMSTCIEFKPECIDYASPPIDPPGWGDPTYIFPPWGYNHKYFWRVRAVDPIGDLGNWSNIRYFYSPLENPYPTESYWYIDDDTPTFRWTTVNGATGYTMTVFKRVGDTETVLYTCTTTATECTPTTPLPRDLAIYWHVKANGKYASYWSYPEDVIYITP